MKVYRSSFNNYIPHKNSPQENKSDIYSGGNACNDGLNCLGQYNKPLLNFKGYYGDKQSAKKLFWLLTGRDRIYKDTETENNTYYTGTKKKWVTTNPEDLLKRTPEDAIQSICTLNNSYYIPDFILPPDYGNNWGRRANYIEINPRTVAVTHGNNKEEGLLNILKLLPAIPPSSRSVPNCVILSELYPTMGKDNDGKTGYESLYAVDLHSGISKTLLSKGLQRGNNRMGDDEQVRAFNDLAHLRGLKTGIRMPISEGQMRVQGRSFNWDTEENAYVDACAWAIDLGFDSIFFDSAKHVGNYDMGNYCGVGRVPGYEQMQRITKAIRKKTGRNDIAFIGEKCSDDTRFNQLGLTAGTDWGKADNYDSVKYEYQKQAWNSEYAAGPIVSDDNDDGSINFETRINRLGNALNAYDDVNRKLPVFMQMHDIFPLTPYTNTHNEMMNGYNRSVYGDDASHYNNTFNTSEAARNYRMAIYEQFKNVIDR